MLDDIPSDAEIEERMHPRPADIALAKEVMVSLLCAAQHAQETISLVRSFLAEVGQPSNSYMASHYHQPVDLGKQIEFAFWVNAGHQGLVELAGTGLALPASGGSYGASSPTVQITTPNMSRGVSCRDFDFQLAQHYRASSLAAGRDGQGFVLRDPDLYLRRIDAQSMHPRVATTLGEAVACYRAGLYLGAAVLIGVGSEGAWMELAAAWCIQCEKRGLSTSMKLRKEIDSETPRLETVQKLVIDTLRSHGRDDLQRAGINTSMLEQIAETAAYYRNIRNYAVHFREDQLDQLDYATVGLLLLNATRYFSALYRLKDGLAATE